MVPSHQPNCTKTRTARASTQAWQCFYPGQGRPAAALVSWIEAGSACASRQEHQLLDSSWDTRKVRREQLKNESATSRLLLDQERDKGDDLHSEPEHLSMLDG